MAVTLTIHEETAPGRQDGALSVVFPAERTSARELIRAYVYQRVREHNAGWARRAPRPVEVTAAERLLNGAPRTRRLDWHQEYARALQAFERNGFLLFVDDRQVTALDDAIELRPEPRLSFLRLVPLVGG